MTFIMNLGKNDPRFNFFSHLSLLDQPLTSLPVWAKALRRLVRTETQNSSLFMSLAWGCDSSSSDKGSRHTTVAVHLTPEMYTLRPQALCVL